MLVARSLSCSIRDVQCTTQAHMLHARTDLGDCGVIGSRFQRIVFCQKNLHIVYTPSMLAHERSSPPSSLSSSSSTSSTSQVTLPINKHCDDPQNEEHGSVAKTTSSTGYEPKVIDNFDYSETYTAIFQNESVDVDTEPSELDDELIRKALSSPLFTQEREESANLRQTYHFHEERLLPAQSFFTRTSTGRPVYEPSSDLSQKRKSNRDLENEQIRIPLERQKEQILAEVRSETQKHELRADSDRRSIQELTGIVDSQRMEIDHALAGDEQSRRDQLLLQEENVRTKSGSS